MIVEKIMNRNNREIEVFVYKALKPRAVLVLAHGASEHVRRYEDFIEFLISNDISIYTYNHLGHGPNRLQDSVYFAAENGHQYLRDDLEDVSIYAYQHNDLPIILMGHSMGSIIARSVLVDTKFNYNGAIICGSTQQKESIVNGGLVLAKTTAKLFKKNKVNKTLNKMTFQKLEDTLSYNKENTKNYLCDKDCGMPFTNQAIVDLLMMVKKVTAFSNIKKMLQTNYLVIVGQEDPFSNNAKDLDRFVNCLSQNKFNYKYIVYQNMKHEILNEIEHQKVYDDILLFINKRIDNKRF